MQGMDPAEFGLKKESEHVSIACQVQEQTHKASLVTNIHSGYIRTFTPRTLSPSERRRPPPPKVLVNKQVKGGLPVDQSTLS